MFSQVLVVEMDSMGRDVVKNVAIQVMVDNVNTNADAADIIAIFLTAVL